MDFHKQLVQIAHEMDWEDLTDHGSGSCVASHGCAGVTQSDLYEYGDRIRAAVLAESAPPSDLVALLREALEVLPGRGNLRRRIIQTIGESDAPPSAEPDAPPRDNKAMSGTRSETIAPSSGSLPNTSRPADGATTQNAAGQPDLGSSSEPLVTKATSLDTHERSVLNREDAVGSVTACRDEPASPLAPERTVSPTPIVTSNLMAHSDSTPDLRNIATASPLLPGLDLATLEWATKIVDDSLMISQALSRLNSEISRLKGEGRGL